MMTGFFRTISVAALLGASMTAQAMADGTSPAFPFAFTGTAAIGGGWVEYDDQNYSYDILRIVGGGQFVIPVTGYWNIQLGGLINAEEISDSDGNNWTEASFYATAIGFWRDPSMGAFGIESGIYSPDDRFSSDFVRLGAVGQVYLNDQFTITGFGGGLLPLQDPSPGVDSKAGFYGGARLTWYVEPETALEAFATGYERDIYTSVSTQTRGAIQAGATLRHLTSMPGVELFASAAYTRCLYTTSDTPDAILDGAEVLAGVSIRLGGNNTSLVEIDRSNAIDTNFRDCDRFW